MIQVHRTVGDHTVRVQVDIPTKIPSLQDHQALELDEDQGNV